MQFATAAEIEIDNEAQELFERMTDRVEKRLDDVYPEADDDSITINLVPSQNGHSAYLTYAVNDSWIDETKVESIILSVAGESWVGFEHESPGRFLLT